MAKKNKSRVIRAVPPSTAPPPGPRKPKREVIEIHTTTERTRNASGGALGSSAGSTLVPVLGGIAAGTAAVIASQKWNAHSGLVAAGTAAAGLAAISLGKQLWLRQAGAGAVVGAAVVGAVPLVVGALSKSAPHPVAHGPSKSGPAKRSADGERDADPTIGDAFVTRHELNDALGKLADSNKETSKQQTCDLMTAFRDEIRKVVAEGPNGPGTPHLPDAGPSKTPGTLPPPHTTPYFGSHADRARMADGNDEYTRNAYGDDIRDAVGDEYERNAYGDDIRDAAGDEYERNAYGDDLRDADGYERDADGYERDADAYDERNAGRVVRRHRYATNVEDDSGLTDEEAAQQWAQMTGGSSM